jgi:RNA polymerase sigma-70 factor, ECF subfamily
MEAAPKDVTLLIKRFGAGDALAGDELIPLLYKDLRRMASYYLQRERQGHTLQPTALVHEAYLRLMNQKDAHWQNRSQFFALAARFMRRILVDYARRHHAVKRDGGAPKASMEEAFALSKEAPADLLAVDELLAHLSKIDPQQEQVVELRVFAGLTIEEVAVLLNISPATVKRDWKMAKAWLSREMARCSKHGAEEVEPK